MVNAKSDIPLGQATIEPAGEIVAGSFGTWRLSYEAGASGVAVGGRIRVYTDTDSDWGIPQFIDPTAADYLSVESPDGVQVHLKTTGVSSLFCILQSILLQLGLHESPTVN